VQVRNGIVHFRACDIRIVNKEGIITYDHELPDFCNQLKNKKFRCRDLMYVEDMRRKGEAGEIAWVTRLSTPAMAMWAMKVVIVAILYVLERIPKGELKDSVWRAYRPSNERYRTLFHWGLSLIDGAKLYPE
jgi:hypothetical protein